MTIQRKNLWKLILVVRLVILVKTELKTISASLVYDVNCKLIAMEMHIILWLSLLLEDCW